jgi:hypothetical protein
MATSQEKTQHQAAAERQAAPRADETEPADFAAGAPRRRRGVRTAGGAEPPAEAEAHASGSSGSRGRRPRVAENAIRPSRAVKRRQGQVERESEVPRPDRAAPAKPAPAAAQSATRAPADADPWTVPNSVRDRFVQDGRRFYFPDGAPAFKDLGKRLTTPSENTEVVHSLIEIAQARGWSEIALSGTERFRQEAWRQARLAGLAVRGYKPSGIERAQLVRALARGAEAREVDRPDGGGREMRSSEPSGSASAGVQDAPQGKHGPSNPSRERPRERVVGKLIDYGRDTYRHDPHEAPSYFVRIQTKEGKREIWGRDLERAMSKSLSQPQIGDEVALERTGRESVTVKRKERGADGRMLGEQDVSTYRNRWVIERREFFEQRAAAASVLRDETVAPRRAVRQHPELAGTYLNLKAAEIAAANIRDPEDRRRFVSLVRGALADRIERGEPLQPVRLRAWAEHLKDRVGREPPERAPARA